MNTIKKIITLSALLFLAACSNTYQNKSENFQVTTNFNEGVAYSEHAFIVKFYQENLKEQTVLLIADKTDAHLVFEKDNNQMINLHLKTEKQDNTHIALDVELKNQHKFYNTYSIDIKHSLVVREKKPEKNILNFFEEPKKNIIEAAILKLPIDKNIDYQSDWYIIIEPLYISKTPVNSNKKYKRTILPPIENVSEF